ncbi:hypothetical protein NW953_06260 [Staphylococcus aureus]|uniref:HipA family kinase n=1 Tax=Staphylococcus aureus TaxID=1280 RepID=UPI00215C8006|nr:HipA family kinase [Staphylococcus aureus]UVJ32464.1 hypothetical protein NW953_06260 [Staphylococcus aureus]
MEFITEITEDVGNGVTDPIRGYIGDKKIVAKYVYNNEGFISLFNELLGYNLAQFFGIRFPYFGYAFFSEGETKVKNGKKYIHESIFTYTIWLDKALPITSPNMTKFIQENEIVNLFFFDIFIYNRDRNAGNLVIELPAKLYPIDYTHILPGGCIWTDEMKNNEYTIEGIVIDMFSSGYYQYLIENRKISISVIDECGSIFIEKIKKLKVEEIIMKIPSQLINKLSKEQINLLIEYFNYMSENFYIAIKLIKERIGKE